MYEQGHDLSAKDKLLVYAGLSNISSQIISEATAESVDYYHKLNRGFHSLMLQTLASFPMLTPASMETVEAMLCAVRSAALSSEEWNGELT